MSERRCIAPTLSDAEADELRRAWHREAQRRYRRKLKAERAPSYDDLVFALALALRTMQPYQEEEAPALHRLRQTLVGDLTERGYSADAVWRQFQRNFY